MLKCIASEIWPGFVLKFCSGGCWRRKCYLERFSARDGGLNKITAKSDPGDAGAGTRPIWLLAASGCNLERFSARDTGLVTYLSEMGRQ